MFGKTEMLINLYGHGNIYHINRVKWGFDEIDDELSFLDQDEVREALHIDNRSFENFLCNEMVFPKLLPDFMKPRIK